MINYNGKIFSPVDNSPNEESYEKTFFVFRQTGKILSSNYSGGKIVRGHMLSIVDEEGCMELTFHHINTDSVLITGTGTSVPEILPNGKIKLLQKWKSTTGEPDRGNTVLIEH